MSKTPPDMTADRLEQIADKLYEQGQKTNIIEAGAILDLKRWANWLRAMEMEDCF